MPGSRTLSYRFLLLSRAVSLSVAFVSVVSITNGQPVNFSQDTLLENLPDMSVGISGSSSLGFLWGTAPIYGGGSGCGEFGTGSLSGGEVALRLRLHNFPAPRFFVSLRTAWRSERGRLIESLEPQTDVTREDPRYSFLFDPVTETAIRVEREAELDVSAQSFRLAIYGGVQIDELFSIATGPVIGYNYRMRATQSERIVSPEEIAYPDGQRRLDMPTGAEYETRPLFAGLGAVGRIELPLGDRLHLGFDLDLAWDFRSPVVGAPWKAVRLNGGIGLQYHLRDRVRSTDHDVPIATPPVPQTQAFLSADIELYTENPDGTENDVIDVEFDEIDFCTVVLPSTSLKLPSSLPKVEGQDDSIDPSDLVRLSDSVLHSKSLELAVLRLAGQSPRRIEIVYSPDERSAGLKGAARLRAWLSTEYGIPGERVTLTEGRPDELPPGRIILGVEGENAPSPLRAHRLDREFGAPTVKVRTSQEAEAGVRGWEVTLSNDSMVIARYSNAQPEGRGSTGIDWSLLYSGNDIDSSKLEAVFMIQDSLGGRAISRTENRMIVRRIRVTVGRIVDLENGSTTILLALPRDMAPELKARAAEMLLERFRLEYRPTDHVETAREIAYLPPETPVEFADPERIDELIDLFGNCGSYRGGIDPSSVIVLTRVQPSYHPDGAE